MKKHLLSYACKAALTLAVCWLFILGVRWALNEGLNHLMTVWGVNAANLTLAPGWVQLVVYGYASGSSAIAQGLMIPLAALCVRILDKRTLAWGRGAVRGAGVGIFLGAVLVALLALLDAVRFGGSILRPDFSWAILSPLALYLASALGGEALFRGALLGLGPDVPGWVKMTVSTLAFALMTAPLEPLALISALLMGALMCLIYQRTRGFGAGALLRSGLYIVLYGIMGCAGGVAGAPYETYPSQLDRLSGGASGPMSGLLFFALLIVLAIALVRRGLNVRDTLDFDQSAHR